MRRAGGSRSQRLYFPYLLVEYFGIGSGELADTPLAHVGRRQASAGDLALEERDELGLSREVLTLHGDGQDAVRKERGPELFEEGLAVSRRVLGEEHPSTLISMYNLCCVLERGDEIDQEMVEMVKALLEGVRKLPEGTPVRVAAEKQWGSFWE